MSSITVLNGSSRGEVRLDALRAGGIALANACRTVRRCTRCLAASSRIDNPSTRASRLISANSSTLDRTTLGPFRDHQPVGDHGQAGPAQAVTTAPACRKMGPNQTVTTTSPRRPSGATSNRHAGANSGCHGQLVVRLAVRGSQVQNPVSPTAQRGAVRESVERVGDHHRL